MKKLVTLMQEQLPNSARGARAYLLEQLFALEGEALETKADAGTLRSIRSELHPTQRPNDGLLTGGGNGNDDRPRPGIRDDFTTVPVRSRSQTASLPPAAPHAKTKLMSPDATPGTGALPPLGLASDPNAQPTS
ncbi:hypothetical protein [Methylorubrum extorquens]